MVSDLLQERLSPTSSYVESLIAIEKAYINTNHSDFLGAAGAMAQLESQNKKHRALERKRAAKMSQINGRIEQAEKETLQAQHTHQESAHQLGTSPKGDSFLTYFFGGANKHERPALGSMDLAHNSVAPPSISKVVEAEMEKQLGEKLSLKEQSEPSQTLQRDELEVKLIRKCVKYCATNAEMVF